MGGINGWTMWKGLNVLDFGDLVVCVMRKTVDRTIGMGKRPWEPVHRYSGTETYQICVWWRGRD